MRCRRPTPAWFAMTGPQQDAIASPGAWLTTVASRVCLDVLGSARARREHYVGEWIPEPLPERTEWISGQPGAPADPADRITLDGSVSMAFLVVLESMTPAERVAFILHDVYGYPFTDVAQILGRSPAACRQLATSARRRTRTAQPPAPPTPRQAAIVREFKESLGSQEHQSPHRPARPRCDGGRRRRPGQRRAVPDSRWRADRPLPG
jgi:DNA-directed RNA polymerase specialized sigma24 family protein